MQGNKSCKSSTSSPAISQYLTDNSDIGSSALSDMDRDPEEDNETA